MNKDFVLHVAILQQASNSLTTFEIQKELLVNV